MNNLLIKGGRVIDPARGIDEVLDVALTGDRIGAVARDIPAGSCKVVDARGKIVTPGLIDMHSHVYPVLHMGLEPDLTGIEQGVTTLIDAGSAGQATFEGFPRYVIPASRTRVLCFLNVASRGLSIMPEITGEAEIDLDAARNTIAAHRDIIVGVKLRLVGNWMESRGPDVLKKAKKLAGEFGLPVMVHIGDHQRSVTPGLARRCLPLLESGDILSHIYTSQRGGFDFSDPAVVAEVKSAVGRGVVLECSLGKYNFSFEVARKGMELGILPAVVSTDISFISASGPVYSLTVTMSKFLALGLELNQVIALSTINPARVLGMADRLGSLGPGMVADISILELKSGQWKLVDSEDKTVVTSTVLAPGITIKSGQVIGIKSPILPPSS